MLRERDQDDERSLAITLTDTGAALRAEAETVPGQIVERLGLPLAELIEMRQMLTRVIAAAGSS